MGIEHITDALNKPTDREHIVHVHTIRVANTYHHWPKKAYEATQARLPTLHVLSYGRNIAGMELENIKNIQTPNHIAISIRNASEAVDQHRVAQ